MTNTATAPAPSTVVCAPCSYWADGRRVQVRHSIALVREHSLRPAVASVSAVVDFVPEPVAPAPVAAPAVVAGSVWVAASGALIRVRKARTSDRLLAAELVGSDESGVWEYRGLASRVLRQLGAVPASAERVALFGHRSGSCVFCSRQLDDERSLAAGYGPVCAGKFDLPWGW